MKAIEKLICIGTVCSVPNTSVTREKNLQWCLFCKKQAQSELTNSLTQGSLHKALLYAHQQAMMWNNDVVANSDILWLAENSDNRRLLVMSNLPLASEAIIQLVKSMPALQKWTAGHSDLP